MRPEIIRSGGPPRARDRDASPAMEKIPLSIASDADATIDAIAVLDPGRSMYERLRKGFWVDGTKVYRAAPASLRRGSVPLLVMVLDADADWTQVASACAAQPTLLVAAAPSAADALRAIDIAARGYLPASISDKALIDAIRGIRAGEVAFSRAALGAWLRRRANEPTSAAAAKLTPRQRQIMSLVARGASDKEIGAVLGIATATAQKHVTNLLRRLGAPNRAAAVGMMALELPGQERRAG
jgi:DNA-binding NarL/FixJ family response regulator